MISAGIKDLKNRLSFYMRKVKRGEKIIVTEREKIIATIVPMDRPDMDSMLLSLVKEGFAVWRGGKPTGCKKPVKIRGKTVSGIVLEDRR